MPSPGLIAAALIFLVLGVAILCFLTGNTRRSYAVYGPSDSVVIADAPIRVEQLAASSQPQLFQRPGDFSPPALAMWWEAIDAGESIALVYHPVWEDERHPVPILHNMYLLYRILVYGLPVRDIEYIQININKIDGSILRIRYEGSSAASYNDSFPEHTYITVDRTDSIYTERVTTANRPSEERPIHLTRSRLTFGIATWSHQLTLLQDRAPAYVIPVPMPLDYLTDTNYTKYRLARRSQGDFVTNESFVAGTSHQIVRILMLGPPRLLSSLSGVPR
jgi:hypothetical protein